MSATSIAMDRALSLGAGLADPRLDVMNFLNEVILDYPGAVSLAPGRPLESLSDFEAELRSVETFVEQRARQTQESDRRVWQQLGQYGRTNGSIGDWLAAHLSVDEGIEVEPDALMVTVGAQEAMAVLLAGLFRAPTDILLVSDPTYVGMTGLAAILGVQIVAIPTGESGLDPEAVERTIVNLAGRGRVRALYDVPTFNNPLGTTLGLPERHELLAVCRRHGVLLFEDHAYGMLAYDGAPPPSLKALDRDGVVVHIGSFSKTLCPGLRVGYLVADQRVSPGAETLARALSRVKSLLTVNTPPPMQAAVAGVLHRHGGSLEPVVAPKRAVYRQHRDAMVGALERTFADLRGLVAWNVPSGGFFLALNLPFSFGPAEVRRCAAEHGVIVCPMQFFCVRSARPRQVRLSFSYVNPAQIVEGIDRLGQFVRQHLVTVPVSADPRTR